MSRNHRTGSALRATTQREEHVETDLGVVGGALVDGADTADEADEVAGIADVVIHLKCSPPGGREAYCSMAVPDKAPRVKGPVAAAKQHRLPTGAQVLPHQCFEEKGDRGSRYRFDLQLEGRR